MATDAEILHNVRSALRQSELQNVHLRGAWVATAEEYLKQIPAPRRKSDQDLLGIARCLGEAGKFHQAKNWDKMTSFIESTHRILDRLIGAD